MLEKYSLILGVEQPANQITAAKATMSAQPIKTNLHEKNFKRSADTPNAMREPAGIATDISRTARILCFASINSAKMRIIGLHSIEQA